MKDMQALWLNSKLKKIVLFICFFGFAQLGFSQKLTTTNWYFGKSSNGIKFSRGTAKAEILTNKAIDFGAGGSAVATDPVTGNLFFYTDGKTVYDACHKAMEGGSGLNGNTAANQPVVISAVPGKPSQYYIFTNSASYSAGGEVSVSIVDLSEPGNSTFPNPPLGKVISINQSLGLTGRSEGMVILSHANGEDFWLITHKVESADYSATRIRANGVFQTITTTDIGSPVGIPISVANFAVSSRVDPAKPEIRKIAVAPQTGKDDAVILNFNHTTGAFALDSYIFNTGKTTLAQQAIYDIEWDAKGQYLYLSFFGDAGITADVLQYDYTKPTNTLTSVLPASLKPSHSMGLQIGPDSAMYYLYETTLGNYNLGRFTKTDTIASQVKFEPQSLGKIDFMGTQFPSFLPDKKFNIKVTLTPVKACQNAPAAFYPTVSPGADSLVWDFGDGTRSNAWSPVHTFRNAGPSSIKVAAFLQGQRKDTTISVDVKAFGLKITLVQDTTACCCELPKGKQCKIGSDASKKCEPFSVTAKVEGGTPASAFWSTNKDVGLTLKPDSAGYYYLTISDKTDGTGCEVSAGVNVKEYGLSDQRSNKWYFGKNAGIDFNKTPPKALNDGKMNTPEGCAIVCDRNGQTIFYTNGDEVYNRDNERTTNGFGLGGSPLSSQSSLIFPVPGDETLYYIFTTEAFNETGSNNRVHYSLFDWKENNGKGDIVEKNVLLFAKATERITANGNWVIFHEYGNDVFRSYRISPAGIGSPVFSNIGSDHSQCGGSAEGYMRLGPNNTLAVPLSNKGNFIELFHLNDTTGHVVKFSKDTTNNRLYLKEADGIVYGVEFAASNKKGLKLFATVKNGAASKLVEFAIDSLSKSTLLKKDFPSGKFGAIQTAPNGAIYVAVENASSLAQINPGSDLTTPSTLEANGFALASGTTSLLGLPNFRQQQGNGFGGPSFTFTGVCYDPTGKDSTKFTGQGTDSIDKYAWSFGDGASSTEQSPAHLYGKAGIYNVTLRVYNRCGLDTTLTSKVTVFAPPDEPSIKPEILCKGPVRLDANISNTPDLTYSWSTGDTTKTIIVNRNLAVSVTNTNKRGCSSQKKIIVADNRPEFDLGPDQIICQNDTIRTLDAGNRGATYVWKSINAAGDTTNIGTTQKQVVSLSPGVLTYFVKVTDPTTSEGCFLTDKVTYTINVIPQFTLSKRDPTGCGFPTGEFEITINSTTPAGGDYSYELFGPDIPGNPLFYSKAVDQLAGSTSTFPGRVAGTFSAVVTDQISGCTYQDRLTLVDADWKINAEGTTCDPSTVTITVTDGTPFGGISALTYTATGTGIGSPIISPPALLTLPEGTWTIEAKDGAGCIAADPEPLVVSPNPIISIEPNSSCDQLEATLTGGSSGYTVEWTLPNGTKSSGLTVSATSPGIYKANAKNTDGCSATETEYLVDVIIPEITQSIPCSNEVIVTATPAGNYSYSWSKDNDVQTNLVGSQILLGSGAEGSYKVTLRDRDTGCSYPSNALAVNIVGNITASLSSTPPCKDGKEFILTASSPSIPSTGVKYAWTLNGSPIPETTFSIKQSTEGKYQVTVSSVVAPACKSLPSITIVRNAIPEGNLPSGAIICADPDNKDPATAKVELNPGAFLQYQWYKNEVLLAAETKQKLTATSAGSYKVELTNSFNCTASDVTEVRNECIPKLVAPTAFSPGSKNAVNQNFFVCSFFITDEFEVTIFNRWGELMYESKDKNFKWNGTYNNQGQPLPPGMYAYSIKYVSSFRPEKGIQEQRGGVVLIR